MKCVIYDIKDKKVIAEIVGEITIDDEKIVNERGEGLKGYKKDRVGYILADDLDVVDISKPNIFKHKNYLKEIEIKRKEKEILRSIAIKEIEKGSFT